MRDKFTVIRDTREHKNKGWFFKESDYCQGMIERKLDTGDYSIDGLEDILCIERKASVSEIAANLVDKRFDRELDRMESFKHKFLILEFSVEDIKKYPEGSEVPKKAWSSLRVKGNFIIKRLAEIQVNRKIPVVPCGDKYSAWYMAGSIMKRVNELENV